MEYFELLERRFSVRGYLDKEVKQSDLEKVCEAVRLARELEARTLERAEAQPSA